MPYVNVYVEAEDILDDLSDSELMEELASRRRHTDKTKGNPADYSIPQKAARYTLEEAADIFRKMGRTDLAFKLEEIRTDFVGH